MDTKAAQSAIAAAVARRGYRDGYTAEQFAARQVAKAYEELHELERAIVLPGVTESSLLSGAAHTASYMARILFDNNTIWKDSPVGTVFNHEYIVGKLADLVVVAMCLADALGEPDILARALEKATKDEARGVRQ